MSKVGNWFKGAGANLKKFAQSTDGFTWFMVALVGLTAFAASGGNVIHAFFTTLTVWFLALANYFRGSIAGMDFVDELHQPLLDIYRDLAEEVIRRDREGWL